MLHQDRKRKLVVLAGSGSGGPVTPLLAVADSLKSMVPGVEFLFVGSKNGVEEQLAKNAGIKFIAIFTGKLRRYWSLSNFVAPFQIVLGFVQSYSLLKRVKASAVVGAGGFVQVPVMWAAWWLGIPVIVHQQDVQAGLANRLCAPIADLVTVTFPESRHSFPRGWILQHLDTSVIERVIWTGNPVRNLEVPSREKALTKFRLDHDYPTVLVMGGGTGALALNELLVAALPKLLEFTNVIHIVGKGRIVETEPHPRYRPFEFLADMGAAYGASDVVFARAGLGTITELALVRRPAIIVPMPGSHQEANAAVLANAEAALVLEQGALNPDNIVSLIRGLLFEHALARRLEKNLEQLMPPGASERLAELIAASFGVDVQAKPEHAQHSKKNLKHTSKKHH